MKLHTLHFRAEALLCWRKSWKDSLYSRISFRRTPGDPQKLLALSRVHLIGIQCRYISCTRGPNPENCSVRVIQEFFLTEFVLRGFYCICLFIRKPAWAIGVHDWKNEQKNSKQWQQAIKKECFVTPFLMYVTGSKSQDKLLVLQ